QTLCTGGCRADHFVMAPRRPRNNSVGTRSFGGKAACGRRLRMTSFLLQGAAPPAPLLCKC
ncbi:MAG: hypothetical protein IIX44_11645, partial [Clostridia bacterium]|nr:hypothetical protein [Clostridia bacterium]